PSTPANSAKAVAVPTSTWSRSPTMPEERYRVAPTTSKDPQARHRYNPATHSPSSGTPNTPTASIVSINSERTRKDFVFDILFWTVGLLSFLLVGSPRASSGSTTRILLGFFLIFGLLCFAGLIGLHNRRWVLGGLGLATGLFGLTKAALELRRKTTWTRRIPPGPKLWPPSPPANTSSLPAARSPSAFPPRATSASPTTTGRPTPT